MRRLAALAALTATLAFASSAQAAPSWSDGPVQRSYIQNCVSYSFPEGPYVEEGAWTWSGQYLDPANFPNVNETFYVHVVAGAVGNACPGQRVHFEILGLPVAGMSLAITPSTPVYCWAINWNTNPASAQQEPAWPTGSCPQYGAPPVFNTNAASFDSQTNGAGDQTTWPLPQGRGWEIQIPVKVDHPLSGGFGNCNDCNRFESFIIDGNSSPRLVSSQGLFVESSGGTPGGGGGPSGGAGGTGQPLAPIPQKQAEPTAPKCKKGQTLKKGKCVKKKKKKRKKK